MRRMLTALAATLIAVPAFAADIPAKIGQPYSKAREALISAGWKAPAAERDCGAEWRENVCTTYQETESCSGTGMGFCAFRFVDADGKAIRVVTTGETVETLIVHDTFAVTED